MTNPRSNGWSDYCLWLLVACAGVVILLVVHRAVETRFGWPPGARPEAQAFVREWRAIAESSRDSAWADAKVTMIVFTDFQCPYCQTFAKTVAEVREHYGQDLAIVVRHYPLSIHSEAEDAAVASECARLQGAFWDYHDILFEDQDVIGARDWSAFATVAGVGDLGEFERCVAADSVRVAVRGDMAVGIELEVTGTPTFILNGSLYRGAMSGPSLRRAIEWHIRKGDMP